MRVEHSEEPQPEGDALERADRQGRSRDQAGRQRDAAAGLRDDLSARRDQAADARDQQARRRTSEHHLSGDAHDSAAMMRAADADRTYAHVDRVSAANDRTDAAIDRQESLADRMAAARDRRQASVDSLTGVYNREAGLSEMHRDLARASRTAQLVTVAFLDVDHLKTINDTHGHAAGDRALIAVADALTAALRPYDLVIRYGGDEFLCTVEGLDLHAARIRFNHVNDMLGHGPGRTVHGVSVTAGVAQLEAGESTDSVIARADADLYHQRHQRSGQHRT